MSTNSLPVWIPKPFKGDCFPLILGGIAAVFASLLVFVPLSAVAVGALLILILSSAENDRFLIVVIFLTPVGWVFGKAEAMFSAFPARSNIDAALILRCLVIIGFLGGRLWRRQVCVSQLLRPSLAKASLGFAVAVVASALLSAADLRLVSLLRATMRMTAYLGFFFVIVMWCGSSSVRVKKVAYVLLLSTSVAALFAIVQSIAGGYTAIWHYLYPPSSDTFPWNSRSTSFLDYPNDLASYLNLILPFALACCATREPPWKNVGALTFALGATALFCTQSRGGMIAFLCMLLAAVYFLVGRLRTRILVLCTAAALVALSSLAWVEISPEHLGWDDLSSGATRLYLWGVAQQLFVSSPLHGVGWGNFQVLYGAYLDSSLVGETQLGVHNTYLALLAETGILGFLTFVVLLVLAFREASRFLRVSRTPFDRALGFGVAGAILAMVVQGFVEFQIAFTQFGILFWTLLALLAVSIRLQRESSECRPRTSPAGQRGG